MRFIFPQYLVGKLADSVTAVEFSTRLILVTYLEPKVTIVRLGKEINFSLGQPDSLEKCDPRISTVDILGQTARR